VLFVHLPWRQHGARCGHYNHYDGATFEVYPEWSFWSFSDSSDRELRRDCHVIYRTGVVGQNHLHSARVSKLWKFRKNRLLLGRVLQRAESDTG
jgi:hypothetical protein